MSLTQQERNRYETVWQSLDAYGANSPGEQYVPLFLQMVDARYGWHILDAGCGSGRGALALAAKGFRVTMCDITDAGLTPEAKALPFREACLWQSLKGLAPAGYFDYVYCCDVLEHVPPQFTMLVIEQLLRVTRKGLFLGISLRADEFGALLGTSLHLTVESFVFWRDALKELGTVVEARDLLHSGVYYVEPR